jgi:hypothetical protein
MYWEPPVLLITGNAKKLLDFNHPKYINTKYKLSFDSFYLTNIVYSLTSSKLRSAIFSSVYRGRTNMADKPSSPAKGDEVIVHVPTGSKDDVKIVEVDPEALGQDITVQVSRERKPKVSSVLGVIVK